MIEYLQGILITKETDHIIVNVNGVGYGIDIPLSTYNNIGEIDEEVKLFIFLYIREDVLKLFGFSTYEERDIFEVFLNTSGIGPKTSISILSTVPPEEFINAILTKNIAVLTKIPGIGKKTAERLIIELSDKVKLFPLPSTPKSEIKSDVIRGKINDAIDALIALGCKPFIANKAINEALQKLGLDASTEDLIKEGLKYR